MASEYPQSGQFRGARIHLCDLAGLEIRDCELSDLKIVDRYGIDVYLGGDFERLVVNDVDVPAYVDAQLDRQHPTRVLVRDAASPDNYRAAWAAIETLWEATIDRTRRLPEAELHEQVNGEWSLVEIQRHLAPRGLVRVGGHTWLIVDCNPGRLQVADVAPHRTGDQDDAHRKKNADRSIGVSGHTQAELEDLLPVHGTRDGAKDLVETHPLVPSAFCRQLAFEVSVGGLHAHRVGNDGGTARALLPAGLARYLSTSDQRAPRPSWRH